MKFKIGKYFTTYSITAGLSIAMLGSAFIYLSWFDFSNYFIETVFALLFFWFLLQSEKTIWFWTGVFISLFWFWWILLSFEHYQMPWAIPVAAFLMAITYGFIFWSMAWLGDFLGKYHKSVIPYTKGLALLMFSYLHPFGFDWFKPELVLVHTYLGIHKWQLGIILLSIILAGHKKNIYFLLPIVLAYSPVHTVVSFEPVQNNIQLVTTMTTVQDKWNSKLVPRHIQAVFANIDNAISQKRGMVILPESVFPFFLNNEPEILEELLQKSKSITIIIGALYLENKIHRNSTYIIQNGKYTVAHKVVMVPFGESNPLPQWASKWVNKIFFDGAIDYIASAEPTDFEVGGDTYRNAICYESTSEILYKNSPKSMIAISNNGWFIPSIEPTQQRLLLEFYSRKYGTVIYHAINMSRSYTVQRAK